MIKRGRYKLLGRERAYSKTKKDAYREGGKRLVGGGFGGGGKEDSDLCSKGNAGAKGKGTGC